MCWKNHCVNVLEYLSLCVFRVQNIVQSVETFRTASSVWISVPVVWRRISKLCGSTTMLQDTVCYAAATAHCREWTSHTHKHTPTMHRQWEWFHTQRFSVSAAPWWMRGGAPLIPGQGELRFLQYQFGCVCFFSEWNWTNSRLFEESELSYAVFLCLDRVQPSRLQWVGWCSSSSCWLCSSSTWGDRRSWRGRKQWGGSCKNMRWAQIQNLKSKHK